jgi:hypothetical protein
MSCRAPVKEDYGNRVLHYINVNLKEEFIGNGGAVIAYKDGMAGIEESGSLPPFFFLSEKEHAHTYTHFGRRGQGPDEFIRPYPIQYLDDDVFGVYELMLKTYREVTVPRNGSPARTAGQVTLSSRPFSAIKTACNQYAGLSTREGLLVLMDSAGKEIASFFEYPWQNEDEHAIKNHLRAMAYQGTLAANPQKTKCVYAALAGEIIHFYSIQKDQILLVNKIEKTYPLYKPEDNGTSYSSMMDWDNTVGYISLAATDRFVYALYCGKTYRSLNEENGSTTPEGCQLRIFDWTGKMVKTCTLDVPCRYIGVTGDDSRLWAMACLPEVTPVYFDLNEMPANDIVEEATPAVKEENRMEKAPFPVPAVKKADGNAATPAGKDDSSKVNQLNAGKIKPGEIKKYTLPLRVRVTSLQATSEDIVLRDSVTPSGQSWIFISLTKQKTGKFNDTIYLSSDAGKITLVVSGEVIR